MAPSLRSARTDHPKLGTNRLDSVDGCSSRRTHGGGFLRSKWRAGAGVMFANCLISTGMVLLLVQCALATEDETTYDASGSSSSPSDPTVTAVPMHPLADGAVSEGGELRGQPAFSSVLTFLAGTDKHPSSLGQSRTTPTITRDKNHTSHRPSDVSSQGSEMSSSSSSMEPSKNLSTSSGLNSRVSYKHTIAAQAVTVVSTLPVSSIMDKDGSISSSSPSPSSSPALLLSSSFPQLLSTSSPPNNLTNISSPSTAVVRGALSLSSSSTSLWASTVPSPEHSTSTVLSQLLPLISSSPSSSGQRISRAASSQGQWTLPNLVPQPQPAALASAGSQRWTEGLTSAQSTEHSVGDLPTVFNRSLRTAVTSSDSITSNTYNKPDISNKEPTRSFNSLWDKRVTRESTGTVKLNLSHSAIFMWTQAKIKESSYSSSNQRHISLPFLDRNTKKLEGRNINLTHNRETSPTAFYGPNIQADQSQQVTLQTPKSALLSPEGYSVSAFTRERMKQTPNVDKDKNVADTQPASAVTMSSANSLFVNPSISLDLTSGASGAFFAISSRTPNMIPDNSSISKITKVAPLSLTNKPIYYTDSSSHGPPRSSVDPLFLESYVAMDHANKATESFQRNSTNDPKITDRMFHKKTIPTWLITTLIPSFNTTKGFLKILEHFEDFSTGTASEVDSDALLVPLKRQSYKDDFTILGNPKQSSLSSLSETIMSMRTDRDTRSQDTVTSRSSNRYSTAKLLSANTTSSIGIDSPTFRSSPKLTEPQAEWKPANPVISKSTFTQSENSSIILDTINTPRPASDLMLEHSREGVEQSISKSLVLNSTATAIFANVSYSVQPNRTEQFHLRDTPEVKTWSLSLSPANLISPMAVSKPPGATDELNNFLQLSHTSHETMTSPSDTLLRSVHNSKQSSPGTVIDVGFPESISATEKTFRNYPAAHISATYPNPNSQADLRALAYTSHSSSSSSSSSISSPVSETLPLSSLYTSSTSAMPSSSWSSSLSLLWSSLPSDLISHADMTPTSRPTMSAVISSSLSSSVSIMSTGVNMISSSVTSPLSQEVTKIFVIAETGTEEKSTGTSRETGLTLPKENETRLTPFPPVNNTLPVTTTVTSQVSPLTPQQDTTTTSPQPPTGPPSTNTKTPMTTQFTRPIPESLSTTTLQPTATTRRTTTTVTTRTPVSRRTFTPHIPRTNPRGGAATVIISPFTTTTTEAPPQQCNITERMWVKTVVSIYVRRNRLDSIQRQNLRRGLSQGLRKALNDSTVQAQVETVFGSPNMTVAYHVTGGDIVYPPSVVLMGLEAYGRDRLIADLRQYLPMVTALPVAAALWRPNPATGFQVKTVLRFVGAGDDPRSCRFSQMMEQRLENVFSEAQAKVLHPHSKLSVQMLSVSQFTGSPAVSLVYTVKNGTVFLNGTTASNLLTLLTAELVGYFLFYPPLIIAEPLEYHNLNTSIATRDFWVITVIQDVDNSSLEGQYQSFASLMEQRLAELFVVAGQQGTRFRRATNVGSYTVQMVSMRRVAGSKNPAEMTYYVQQNGMPLLGTSAAKVLNTVDSQTMALTLGFFVQLQAEPVVKTPPNNLWIIAAVLAPIAVVTLIIIIITAVLCRKNKNDFKADAIGNLNPRAKMVYRRDVGYFHQPVQGFDYAKQHLGQQGGDEETLPVTQDTLRMSLQIRDTPLSLEKAKMQQDGTANKKNFTSDIRKSRLPSEDGSVISNESEQLNSSRGLTVQKVTAQQKLTKEETRARDDPYNLSSGSLQLLSIKPIAAQHTYSQPASSDRSQDSAILNGEVSLALKQKSDIEHYRNKLRLKAKRKGYYDFPSTNASNSSSSRALEQRPWHGHERTPGEHGRALEPDDERGSTYVKSRRRHSQAGQPAYRSRQSLNSPSPGGTELDLLVMRERPRRGIRNSGYDTEPELIEETNVDRLMGPRGYVYCRGVKGHSETSTLSSQPSIDEVRQQMHLLLEEAFSLASGGHSTSGRQPHHHHHHQYSPTPPPLPYTDVVTSAPGTMRRGGRGGLQWVPSYGADMYQCSLPKPAFRFTQLPDMAMGSPPPPLPPRTGPPLGTSLKRSASDLGPKGRHSEISVNNMQDPHDSNPYGPTSRVALPSVTAEQPVPNYSGNPITAVYAIPATSPDYSDYCVSTPPTSYRSPSWMSYPPEPEDVPPQWADSVPLPGYVEAFPHPRYPQGSPRLTLQYNQAPEQDTTASNTASQQSLPQAGKMIDSVPLSSLSTSALVEAIRQEVAKLAKKQSDMFEFQV